MTKVTSTSSFFRWVAFLKVTVKFDKRVFRAIPPGQPDIRVRSDDVWNLWQILFKTSWEHRDKFSPAGINKFLINKKPHRDEMCTPQKKNLECVNACFTLMTQRCNATQQAVWSAPKPTRSMKWCMKMRVACLELRPWGQNQTWTWHGKLSAFFLLLRFLFGLFQIQPSSSLQNQQQLGWTHL